MEQKEGASTITQQLVKNTSLTNEKSWLRKTKEAMGAIYLERIKSKDEILEYYLNEIYFGHGIYGIEEASQFFFPSLLMNYRFPKAQCWLLYRKHPIRILR